MHVVKYVHWIYPRKNSKQEVVIFAVTAEEDRQYLDIRKWFWNRDAEEYRPSKKGLTIPARCVEGVRIGAELLRQNLPPETLENQVHEGKECAEGRKGTQ